jgi:hypothetical protein
MEHTPLLVRIVICVAGVIVFAGTSVAALAFPHKIQELALALMSPYNPFSGYVRSRLYILGLRAIGFASGVCALVLIYGAIGLLFGWLK